MSAHTPNQESQGVGDQPDDLDSSADRLVIDLGHRPASNPNATATHADNGPKVKRMDSNKSRKRHTNDSSSYPLTAKSHRKRENDSQSPPREVPKQDASTWVRTVSSATEAESLGPCPPGTQVSLDGIVWNETASGVLVVNVTWRGKSYVGSLLDCSQYDWAPPRLCESPVDVANQGKSFRNHKRGTTVPAGRICHSVSTTELCNRGPPSQKYISLRRATGDRSNSNGEEDVDMSGEEGPPAPASETVLEHEPPPLTECPCRRCDKKFSEASALLYHQEAAHFPRCSPDEFDQDIDDVAAAVNFLTRRRQLLQERVDDGVRPGATLEDLASVAASLSQAQNNNNCSAYPQLTPDQATSLEQLFHVARVNKGDPKRKPPQLEASSSEQDTGAPSPAYSDISDESAPVLQCQVAADKKEKRKDKCKEDKKCGGGERVDSVSKHQTSVVPVYPYFGGNSSIDNMRQLLVASGSAGHKMHELTSTSPGRKVSGCSSSTLPTAIVAPCVTKPVSEAGKRVLPVLESSPVHTHHVHTHHHTHTATFPAFPNLLPASLFAPPTTMSMPSSE